MRRLISADGIPTEGIHGNAVGIPSAQRVRPQGILSFTIEEDEKVSIIFYYIFCQAVMVNSLLPGSRLNKHFFQYGMTLVKKIKKSCGKIDNSGKEDIFGYFSV